MGSVATGIATRGLRRLDVGQIFSSAPNQDPKHLGVARANVWRAVLTGGTRRAAGRIDVDLLSLQLSFVALS